MNAAFLFWTGFLIVSLSFRIPRLVIAIRNARRNGQGNRTAKPMFWVMTFSYLVFLVACAYEALSPEVLQISWTASLIGLAMYIAALVLRERAFQDLGRFFSPDIEVRQGHQVVREGLYAYVRHPLLSCMILEVIGLGLLFNATHSFLLFGGGFYFPVLMFRKVIEEKALVRALGEAYVIYQNEVGAFFPRWQSVFNHMRNA